MLLKHARTYTYHKTPVLLQLLWIHLVHLLCLIDQQMLKQKRVNTRNVCNTSTHARTAATQNWQHRSDCVTIGHVQTIHSQRTQVSPLSLFLQKNHIYNFTHGVRIGAFQYTQSHIHIKGSRDATRAKIPHTLSEGGNNIPSLQKIPQIVGVIQHNGHYLQYSN